MLENSPKYLRDRFFQLRSYVWYELFPKDQFLRKLNYYQSKKEKKAFRIRAKNIVDEATYMMLIFVMKKFFADGTKVAQEAVDIFRDLDIDGFIIGGKEYQKRNENVMLGEKLSQILYDSLSPEVKELIKDKNYPHEIVSMYKAFIREL